MKSRYIFILVCILATVAIIAGCCAEKIDETLSIKREIDLLKNEDPDFRSKAAFNLGRYGKSGEIAITALAEAINDENEDVRLNVARAIGEIGVPSEKAIKALKNRIDDEDPFVRFFVMNSLTILGVDYEGDPTNVMLDAIGDEDPIIRLHALGLLANYASDSVPAKEAVVNALGDTDSLVRGRAAWYLHLFDLNDEDIKALGRTLLDEVEDVQLKTCETLQKIGPGSEVVLDELIRAASDTDWGVRWRVVSVLKNVGSYDKAINALCTLLGDDHPRIRYVSAHALGSIGPSANEALPILREKLNDEDKSVRVIAAGSVAVIGGEIEEMLSIIVEGLNDTNTEVIHAGITAVMLLGPDASPAVPTLIDLLSQDSEFVQIRAVDALASIGPGAAAALPYLEEMLSKTEITPPYRERSDYAILIDAIEKIRNE